MAVASGERRIVSVLVADVAGSTAIGEKLGPERSKFLFDEVVRLMSDGVTRYGGTVAQLAGDGMLALFGAPVAHEDDAERAVRAAIAIQEALERYAEEVATAYDVTLAARVGVNTGPVVVTSEEGDGARRWNALGDTVNVAARIQAAAGEGRVAIGPTTASQVQAAFDLEELGGLELKGKSAPVTTFSVRCEREEERPAPRTPLVGREFELAVLERAMDDLVDGRGVVVSVTGEPGIGKSRLVAEVCERYRGRVRMIEGRGVSYAEEFPYWPMRELLREWLGVGAGSAEARVRLELKAQLAHLLGEESSAAYPFVATLVGLTLEPDAAARVRELNRQSVQRETFRAVYELVASLAGELPVCLVLEDLHWADGSTLELLEELLPVTDEAAVGLVLVHRSERDHRSWALGERARQRYPHRYREIELRPLAEHASRALAADSAQGELPPRLAELLAERAGGNPFFLEEALRDLVERGLLVRNDGRLELVVEPDDLAIPAAVQGALQARLDRLDRPAQEVLSLAAVIGRTFGAPLLERLLPREQLQPALSELQRLDLVVEHRRRPTPEYRFRHGLVQEVAYARLLEPERRRLHRRVGEAIESLHPASREDVYPLLARHFSEADEPERAVDYLLAAGDAARAMYSDHEAIAHYRRARRFLARMGDGTRSRETLFKIALAHHLAFQFEDAEAAYDEAFSCHEDAPPPSPVPTERIEVLMRHPGGERLGQIYSSEGGALVQHLYQGLLRVDAHLNVMPGAADNFRVSGDGLTYLFQLRQGLTWSDGAPLTADDFVYAWERRREERAMTAFLMHDVASAEALDERTLEVRLHEPRSFFPYLLALAWPSHPLPRHLGEEGLDAEGRLVSNGPFLLARFDTEAATLVANPRWSGPRGNVQEVEVRFSGDATDADAEWLEGRYDVAIKPSPADPGGDTVVQFQPGMQITYLGFHAGRPPFDCELVRRAFAHAIDTERLARLVGLGRAAQTGGMIPPAIPGHAHGVHTPFDLELAQRLLAEAGHEGGRGLPELVLALPHWFDPAPLVEMVEALGAHVQTTRLSLRPSRHHDPDAHMWVSGWIADYPDPDGVFRGLLETGYFALFCDDEMRTRLQEARALRDQPERLRRYRDVDRIFVAERAAAVPLAYGRDVVLRRPWIDCLWGTPLTLAHFEDVVKRPRQEQGAAEAVGAGAAG